MLRPRTALVAITGLFFVGLVLSVFTHSHGVLRNDPARSVWIPDERTMPLQLQVAYNDRQVFFRYRWPAARPHVYTDLLRYTDGKWQRQSRTPVGSDPDGIAEDRVAMMIDDGGVPEFEHYGGYITVGANMRDFTGAGADAAHRRKYLPATRKDPADWYSIKDQAALAAQREAGYFLDLWQWRAHLSNPLGYADDQHIAWYRLYDSGDPMFATNWDADSNQPRWMFDPARTGARALRWEDTQGGQGNDRKPSFLAMDAAVPFDPQHEWREGDVIPGRVLRQPSGSRADIRVLGQARWADGYWDVTLARALDTGHPLEDKILRHQGVYSIALSVHRDARASRWHYVSLPLQVGLGRAADLVATRFTGDVPDWQQSEPLEVTLFYPGQVNWQRQPSGVHAGSRYIAKGVPVKYRHKERQLAQYGLELEFDREIRRQWWFNIVAGVLLLASFAFSVSRLIRLKGD
ncbi:MAG: ethylbenzene dehydrogenase-related protein [Steroidobacteraceae bacterium]|nr:ethylbenzene dehydrogenase-related protein [Steroidobacteraceae bacterium]